MFSKVTDAAGTSGLSDFQEAEKYCPEFRRPAQQQNLARGKTVHAGPRNRTGVLRYCNVLVLSSNMG
jgi:hypothetical protein